MWWEHSVEKREILSHQKIFRQINSLVTYLVKPLLSRNFCKKCVRENSRNFHTVVWKSTIKRDHTFHRKINIFSVKLTFLLKKLLKSWFHEMFWAWSRFMVLFHTVICIQCFKFRDDNFSSNHFISKGQFQTHFSQLPFDPTFWHSYGGQYIPSIAPHKHLKLLNQCGAEKSASEILPNFRGNCRV